MFSRVTSCGLLGLEGYSVQVETDLSNGLPLFEIVGLADTAVKEARERVRAAIRNNGIEFPVRRIIVSLAPAETRKEGAGFDLPISIGILIASGDLKQSDCDSFLFSGELALDGGLRVIWVFRKS
jgi:magnesium chelatase family protein